VIVQIYEIHTPKEAEECIALGVDHIGSVLLSEEEWRQPLIKEVIGLSDGKKVKNSIIPLFRRPDTLCRALDYYRPHFVHFCDNLTDRHALRVDPEALISLQAEIRERFPEIQIIRSIPIPPESVSPEFPVLSLARAFEPVSDLFLVDTWVGEEPVQGFIGITGTTADWSRARTLVSESNIPVILAGGLSPDNVYEALLRVAPSGADSCTRTNRVDEAGKSVRFQKDFRKVERFVKEVRRAEAALRRTTGHLHIQH
jgi:phosphoribosylanthranilate isomerase